MNQVNPYMPTNDELSEAYNFLNQELNEFQPIQDDRCALNKQREWAKNNIKSILTILTVLDHYKVTKDSDIDIIKARVNNPYQE